MSNFHVYGLHDVCELMVGGIPSSKGLYLPNFYYGFQVFCKCHAVGGWQCRCPSIICMLAVSNFHVYGLHDVCELMVGGIPSSKGLYFPNFYYGFQVFCKCHGVGGW